MNVYRRVLYVHVIALQVSGLHPLRTVCLATRLLRPKSHGSDVQDCRGRPPRVASQILQRTSSSLSSVRAARWRCCFVEFLWLRFCWHPYSILIKSPEERPSANDVLKLPFIAMQMEVRLMFWNNYSSNQKFFKSLLYNYLFTYVHGMVVDTNSYCS